MTGREKLLGGIVAVAVLLLAALFMVSRLSVHEHHHYAQGKVLVARIVTDHGEEGFMGGKVYYRIDADVRFVADGEPHEQWMPASETTEDRESLVLKLAEKPERCTVTWVPGHVEHARCRLP